MRSRPTRGGALACAALVLAAAACTRPPTGPGGPTTTRPATVTSTAPEPTTTRPAPAATTTTRRATTTTAPGGNPPAKGRNFLVGMYTDGSTIDDYHAYLGYHPEVTYDSSYQGDHHKARCGQPISGLNNINNYPVIPSVFTRSDDYAGSAAGTHDSCYEQLFSGLKAKAATIYAVRIDVEFAGNPDPTAFKGSFNRIVSIAKKHLPARVKYIFNPNWGNGYNGAGIVPESADIIGPDAYNHPRWCAPKNSTECANYKFDPNGPGTIAYWTKIAQQLGKKMALPEWGDDFGDGVYINKVADWAYDRVLVTPGQSNNVVYLGYWDSDSNEDAHLRRADDGSGGSLEAYQRQFGQVLYSGTYWTPLLPTTEHGPF